MKKSKWKKAILKPAIAGGARHTYLFDQDSADHYQDVFESLISNESMLLQEFQENIVNKGEVSFMVFGGRYSHSILKKQNLAILEYRMISVGLYILMRHLKKKGSLLRMS